MMNTKTKRHFSAWVLLSVFVPMMVFSSLHVHEQVASLQQDCTECVNHVPHSGHISLDTSHLHDCVLCQFTSLPFVAAALAVLAIPSVAGTLRFAEQSEPYLAAVCRLHGSRAPPVV